MKRLAPLVATLLLPACATAPPLPRVDLSNDCATSLAALQALPLPAAMPIKDAGKASVNVVFPEVAHCVEIDSGRTAAAIWSLQDAPLPSIIRIEALASDAATLAPRAVLLDADFRPLYERGFDAFSRRGHAFTLDLFLNPGNTPARYLLLTPDAQWVGRQDTIISGQTQSTAILVGTSAVPYHYGTERTSVRHLADTGRLRIGLLQPD